MIYDRFSSTPLQEKGPPYRKAFQTCIAFTYTTLQTFRQDWCEMRLICFILFIVVAQNYSANMCYANFLFSPANQFP
jgi:hypothetical protein